jgi:hypothetical protein
MPVNDRGVWLKIDLNTICCGERNGKMALSVIRRRFVLHLDFG